MAKRTKINTNYDQFGGHPSESHTSGGTFKARARARSGEDRQNCETVASELAEIFMDGEEKRRWHKIILANLRAKALYEKKKVAGKQVKPGADPLPLDLKQIDFTKHQAALMTILAIFHRRWYGGLNAVLTAAEVLSIYPEIEKKSFPGFFLKQALSCVKRFADNENQDSTGVDLLGFYDQKLQDSTALSVREYSNMFKVGYDALRKRLKRLQLKNHNCFVEVADRTLNQPQFLYYWPYVRPIIKDLCASKVASNGKK